LFLCAGTVANPSYLAKKLMNASLTTTTYGILMTAWLMLVLFAIPLLAFNKPLSDLKVRTLLVYSARSTQLPFKELIRVVKRLLLL